MNKEDLDVIIHESKGIVADKESDLNLDGGYFKCQGKVVCYLSISNYHKQVIPVCNLDEFQQRARELGYINGYRWGVEYPTNGKKPDLADDVVVDIRIHEVDSLSGKKPVSEWRWEATVSFRITDQRYKPADTGYLVDRGVELVNQIQEKLESVTEKLEANSWWDYENDKPLSFPPAGIRCLVKYTTLDWIETFIVGIGVDGACVFDLMKCPDTDNAYDGWLSPERFRPLDYFTRKEVEAEKKRVVDAAYQLHYKCTDYEDFVEKLYDAGYLKLPKE